MPAARELYEKYARHRDKFEIFAFHSASAKTFAELDAKMKPIVEERWGGKELPFPVLLDATGESLRRFSIRSLGTHVLIDPDGKVVQGDGLKTLEAELEKLVAEPGGRPKK